MDTVPSRIPGELRDLPLDALRPNAWNPQRMDIDEFELLIEAMRDGGMLDPILVVPIADEKDASDFVILGGEHRWRAAGELGWDTIPAIVLTEDRFQEKDLQKFITLRMNTIHGNLNPEKFRDLYEDMAERYSHDALQALMGFSDSQKFNKLVGGVKEGIKAAGLPSDMERGITEALEEVQSVDDISDVLNKMFTKYGDTLTESFMVFSFGGKEHLYVRCDKVLYRKARALAREAHKHQVSFADVLKSMLVEPKNVDFSAFDTIADEEEPDAVQLR